MIDVMDAEVLRARLLGPMDLRLGEQQLPPLDSARAESLLAYLLLHREAPQARQRLAFLLWPDSTERQAQTNLRKVVHNLRRALPDLERWIELGSRTLRWRPDAPLWLDVEHFERAVSEGRLEEAVETYAGELLEGRYDEWLVDERERLAGLAVIELSASQVWRLVTGRPERLNLRLLVVLCEILDCEPGELVRRADVAAPAVKEPASGRTISEDLRPRPVQLKRPGAGP